MKSRLDLIEGTFKSIFEGNYSLFPWMDEQSILIHKLIECVQDDLTELEGQNDTLPVHFTIYLNPEDHRFFEQQEDWQTAISKIISDLGNEMGFRQEQKPDIQLTARHSLSRGEVQLKFQTAPNPIGQTSAVPVLMPPPVAETAVPDRMQACLILEDESLFPLDKPVINLGRKSTNHLIVDDLRVSRTHAQIRKVGDEYIIFDIGSSGGTYINGERISQRKLKPGDVISLAGIKLIFTEDQAVKVEDKREITSELKPSTTTGDEAC
jgi:FOG: FHA domain